MAVAVAGLVLLGPGCGSGAPRAAEIEDENFVAAAEKVCARQLPPLRADVSDDTPREPGEVAPTVARRADALDELVADLRELELDESARAAVEEWLDDWDHYVDVGRRYAEALNSGDPERYSRVADEGAGPQARISAFARTNDMESCALDGVPLPERESPI